MMDGGLADCLKGYAERLQNGEVLDEPGLGADLDDAAAEIDRQKALLAVGPWDAWRNAEAEVERLLIVQRRLRDELRGASDEIKYQADQSERLRAALEIIAGKCQCIDSLMSNADIAKAALAPEVKRA